MPSHVSLLHHVPDAPALEQPRAARLAQGLDSFTHIRKRHQELSPASFPANALAEGVRAASAPVFPVGELSPRPQNLGSPTAHPPCLWKLGPGEKLAGGVLLGGVESTGLPQLLRAAQAVGGDTGGCGLGTRLVAPVVALRQVHPGAVDPQPSPLPALGAWSAGFSTPRDSSSSPAVLSSSFAPRFRHRADRQRRERWGTAFLSSVGGWTPSGREGRDAPQLQAGHGSALGTRRGRHGAAEKAGSWRGTGWGGTTGCRPVTRPPKWERSVDAGSILL